MVKAVYGCAWVSWRRRRRIVCSGFTWGCQLYVCPDGYKAQFLRYLDKNFMEGVFQYYLEVLFLVFEKNFKKEKKFQKNP
jgi:hypothetical protein